ncbi:MAG: 50S ribosomal protein L29 [Candidatus Helarchaeota archaeon]
MPILRKKQIRKMSNDEIEKKLNDLRNELAKERSLVAGGGAIEKPGRIRELRRTIARLLTYRNLRKLGKI